MDNNIVYINMLGEFTIRIGDNIISDQNNHSKKLWNVLAYLITFRKKEISKNDLTELLWEDESDVNQTGALKTLMHRVRNLLKTTETGDTEFIIRHGNSYAWNNDICCITDTEEFERFYNEGLSAPNDNAMLSSFRKAYNLYNGDFLPKLSNKAWSAPITSYYHTMYIKLVHEILKLLIKRHKFEDASDICLHAMTIDTFNEELHYQLIYSLYHSNNQQAALKQYEDTKNLFLKKFGITPSEKLQSLYKKIVVSCQTTTTDLNAISESLREHHKKRGSFYCEYEVFKDIYRLEERAAQRGGRSIYLCLMTISTINGEPPEKDRLNAAMNKLKNCISNFLRASDIFARYSVSQYILMLPITSYETGRRVLKRITKKFWEINDDDYIFLHYSLQPLKSVDKKDEKNE